MWLRGFYAHTLAQEQYTILAKQHTVSKYIPLFHLDTQSRQTPQKPHSQRNSDLEKQTFHTGESRPKFIS